MFGNNENPDPRNWELPYGQAGGWTRLDLAQTLVSGNRLLTLEICWQTIDGGAPRLSLSRECIELGGTLAADASVHRTRLPAVRLYNASPAAMD